MLFALKMTMEESNKHCIVAVSGGFDPLHFAHVDMFKAAKQLAGKNGRLVVIVNNDNWICKKRDRIFMPEKERVHIIEAIRYVDNVVLTEHVKNDKDVSICNTLRKVKPDIFANGGDRTLDNIPEAKLCKELGIRMVFNVGPPKIQSSSWLLDKYCSG